MSKKWARIFVVGALLGAATIAPAIDPAGTGEWRLVGAARVDITPAYPIRLTGYAARKTESEGVAQHLFARAIAIGSDEDKPAVLITVDNCGVPGTLRDEVAKRLHAKFHLNADRLTICSTHTHSAPQLIGFAPNLLAGPLPPDQAGRIERYTRELTDALEAVAARALEARQPARLTRGQTHAEFAANRRTKGGPVDHDLPALFATDAAGKLKAVLVSYACHCTTVTGEFNQVCGDWAGYAAEFLESERPEAVVLVGLGCAGDANPNPRPGFELAKEHGREIKSAIDELFARGPVGLKPVEGKLVCKTLRIELPFEHVPTRPELEARAKETNFVGSQARMDLARIDRGEELLKQLPYLVQTWSFGDNLALVFLSGEVVVDYSIRLKGEYDASRLWLNAYANDVPCYIPSERILKEGGYEGGGAMVYYDRPSRFAPGVEGRIIAAVHKLLPKSYLAQSQLKQPALSKVQ
jgi:hypothetical protein